MDPPRLLILLELLPNNLALFARKHREHIDLHQWFDWALQMADALVFLHEKGCVHADIKKENMLLTEDLNIKLCDFNSAVFPNPSDPPRDGLGLGTPAYCAPELSRATGGPTATTFSYPIDIFSLGAVLYSLATGYEPFSKARSVVEMLHRKRLFFESEENDRASRLAVEAGSNPNSAPASRRSSLRGRHSTSNEAASSAQLVSSLNRLLHQPTSPTHMRRQTSSDSIDSVASSITSITTISGRNATSLAVARLLEPSDEPRGLLEDPNLPRRSSLLRDAGGSDVRRCASTGGKKAMAAGMVGMQRSQAAGETSSPSTAVPTPPSAITRFAALESTSRPDWLRRRSSYGDELKSAPTSTATLLAPAAPIVEHSTASNPSRLRSMFAPVSPATPSPTSPQPSHPYEAQFHEVDDARAYDDGHPAIVLPGGGRLPDWTRELLRLMLQADPAARPTAVQVRERLRAHATQI
uniref:Protein kinase n=2 Tax=Kalmanozyma brasiliensis (strain GHG001) TaxID=1365824 RepID=V5EXD7_KALBG